MYYDRLTPIHLVILAMLSALGSFSARAADPIDFSREIQPILSDNCYPCHGPDEKKRKATLRFDTKEGAFRLKENKTVIIPSKSAQSELIRRITTTDTDDLMPPPDSNRKLTAKQIESLKQWIDQGAKWGVHWALQPPVSPALPQTARKDWRLNAIDAFVLAKLEKENLAPSPQADKRTLIRRVTLDLTGLPPTPVEIDAFLADSSPNAYEKVVDRLLASPRYGERMSWEWLDAARYADTNGYQGDSTRTMWPWRDWVIEAFNKNMPFDQFTIWQLAGDLLPNATSEQKIATAFCRNHMINGEGGRIAEENRVDYVMDQSETMSTVWLGLTVGCARCHDHKFDPITQREYYQLFAFFNNTPVNGGNGSGQAAPVVDFGSAEQKTKLADLNKEIQKAGAAIIPIEKELFPRDEKQTPDASKAAAGLSGNIVAALKKQPDKRSVDALREMANFYKSKQPKYAEALAALKKSIETRDQLNSSMPRVMVMEEMQKPRDAFILTKGAYDKPTEKVAPGVPASLPPLPPGAARNRLALAKWLVSPENPLTARVTVNRYWQQFFGTGMVKTVEDFGVQGEKPIHQELLDHLASEFVRSGWNIKALHRLIVTSATYRQSSKVTPEQFERDPENRLMSRSSRFRLPVFAIRDQALFAGGLLVEKIGGPPVKTYQPPGIWEEATFGQIRYQQDHGDALYRRSQYIFWRRIVGPTEFFDTAARQTCTVKQGRTNTPLQALTLLNDVTYNEAARALAQRIMKSNPTPEARIAEAFILLLSRDPSNNEETILLAALQRLHKQYTADKPAAIKLISIGESKRDEALDPIEHAAYTALCTIILNLDETITKEQPLNPLLENRAHLTRRALFGQTATGIGAAALSTLLSRNVGFALANDSAANRIGPGASATNTTFAKANPTSPYPHFAPKAKRIIYLFQNGAPSHVDLFDYKPKLKEWHGKEIPPEIQKGKRLSTMTSGQKAKPCLSAITQFAQHGQSGAWVSNFMPHTASIADDLCFVKSMHTGAVNHAPAITFFLTGAELPGRPSMGAWLTYGLGTETENLPGYVVMTSRDKEASCGQIFYDFYWSSGFLPSKFQGVKFRGSGDPVLYLSNPDGMSRTVRRGVLDDIAQLNELKLKEFGDPEIATRIAQYEMAYKMQMSVPELTDLSNEPPHILEMYGPDVKKQGSFAYNCLMARRLAERGVRFVQLMHAGWDQHRNLTTQLKIQCIDTDQPSAALVKDLKSRGLLDDTLVIWGGEFGRTPFLQGDIKDTRQWGRDHHPYGFTLWIAGGGIKPGTSYGETDEFGHSAVVNPVDAHDFQATLLHLLGIDHERMTFKFQGRRFRLTDVEGNVVKAILA